MLVILPVFPLWMTPMAADDEHTDLSSGMAVLLHVKVRPPESGISTFFAVSFCVSMPAAVTGSVGPLHDGGQCEDRGHPAGLVAADVGVRAHLGMYFLTMPP